MRWIAATLLALLVLSWALIALSSPGAGVRPAPDDRGFGGLALFTAALKQAGYRVAFDPSSRPHLASGDVAVAPVLRRTIEPFETPESVLDYARKGGRALVLAVPGSLQPVGRTAEVGDSLGHRANVDDIQVASLPSPTDQIAEAASWWNDRGAIASLTQVGKGRIARLENGTLATNRFLGRLDNAKVVLATLATVARPGDRLVFLASGYGEAEELGVIEAIGPWAVAALWQTLAIMAAFGVSKGIRFGLAVPDAPVRRGSRELLDTLASIYRRGRRTDAPLAAAARERTDEAELQAMAVRSKVSEADARAFLLAVESRPRTRRSSRFG